MNSVTYLGHVISKEGIQTDPEKVSAIRSWPVPKNVKELRQFLGFAGYYRKFIRNFASIVEPLNSLLRGHCLSGKKSKKKNKVKRPTEWIWGTDQQNAFDTLIQKLTSAPILAYADFSKPFVLHTDSSGTGLGAVLYQNQDGVDRVIAYASRGLKPSEKKYPAHKLEFLALKWAVTEKFNDYLYGNTFSVLTDNNPLTYVLSSAKLDATGHRWVAALANYNFTITYRQGKHNADADGLSRRPQIFPDTIQAICQAVTANIPLADTIATVHCPPSAGEVMDQHLDHSVNWKFEHAKDRAIAEVISLLHNGFRPRGRNLAKRVPPVQKLLREWKRLSVEDGVLYRTTVQNGETVKQLVLPESFHETALRGVHDDVGHPGKEKTLWLARHRFYWPGLEKCVNSKVEHCARCVRRKSPAQTAELVPIQTSRPMELVCIDFLSLEKSKSGYEHILVITDHFTRYAQAVPCRNQTAHTTAKALYENFIKFYSFPDRLHSDQGRNFESKVIRELCRIAGTAKSHTTPYHAMGNGSCERFNQTLLKMLGTLEVDQKANWSAFVGPLVQAYNATKSDSTGFSPHFLMFGWHPRLAIDILLGTSPKEGNPDKRHYVDQLRQRIEYAYQKATQEAAKTAEKGKSLYDRKVTAAKLEVGDRVLVRIVAHQGKHKLADRWEEIPYKILRIPNRDIPVFEVQREDGIGPVRKLHRNLLLQFNAIPPAPELLEHSRAVSRQAAKPRTSRTVQRSLSPSSSDSSSSSSADIPRYRIPQRRKQSTLSTPKSPGIVRDGPTSLSPTQDSPHLSLASNPVHEATPDPLPSRPTRNRKPPDRFGDWVTSIQQVEFFV